MKNIILYLSLLFLPALIACEDDIDVYNAVGNDRLNFYYENQYEPDTLVTYTFVYLPEEQMRDTLWFELATSGFLTDYPRTISFEQMPVDSNAAVAGTHYVAFDDPAMQDVYVVPANANRVRVPLIVLKDDPELEEKEFTLRIRIKENEYFKPGDPENQIRTFCITNMLVKPTHWNGQAEWYFAGEYGPVKYRFMIDAAAEIGVTVDDDFFFDLVGDMYSVDMGLTDYWRGFFTTALEEENAARAARGEGLLREAPEPGESEGALVSFDRPF